MVAVGANPLPTAIGEPVLPDGPDLLQEGTDLRVGVSASQQAFQVVATGGEQAGDHLAVGRQSDPAAGGAERFGHRSDDSDLSGAVQEAVVDRGRAALLPSHGLQGIPGSDPVQDLLLGDGSLETPVVGVPHVHVFDESGLQTVLSRIFHQVQDLVVVGAPDHDGVDLDGSHSGVPGCQDPFQNVFQPSPFGDGPELLGVQSVQADVDPAQARPLQRGSGLGQERAVGGEAQVFQSADTGEVPKQSVQVAPDQGLAARNSDSPDAQVDEEARQPDDLFESQQLPLLDPDVLVQRHAVPATVVAPVRHRDSQILHGSAECVGRLHAAHYLVQDGSASRKGRTAVAEYGRRIEKAWSGNGFRLEKTRHSRRSRSRWDS